MGEVSVNDRGEMEANSIPAVAVPTEEKARQAVAALRGYGYQLYQSVLAWITLDQNEELHLEVAEDYAVLAEHALSIVQVKDTPSKPVTLNSPAVLKAVQSLWTLQHANRDRSVRFRFLTTSKVGKEHKSTTPDGQPGLLYWRTAALENGDTTPIRQILMRHGFPEDLQAFIATSTDEAFRERILRPIAWDCGSGSLVEVQQEIADRLVYHGHAQGVPPRDAEKVQDTLIAEVLATAIRPTNRKLTLAAFFRSFESKTMMSVPKADIRRWMAGTGMDQGQTGELGWAHGAECLSELPLPPRSLGRTKLVSRLWDELGQSGVLWLHGSSGTGKSTLAHLCVVKSSGSWLRIDLRDLTSRDVSIRLRSLLTRSDFSRSRGAVLEDLAIGLDPTARQRLAIVAQALRRVGGSLIVTSANEPTPLLRSALSECHVAIAPYLTDEEVTELVSAAGGEGRAWGVTVHLFCGHGHPQLVAARISGLASRGWPESELFPIDDSGKLVIREIEEERVGLSARLMRELPDIHREVLYRLTIIADRFDRDLAMAVAARAGVRLPGEIVDALSGPWVEPLAMALFRVSPLVAGSGSRLLSTDEQATIHHAIVEHLLERRPFPSHYLNLLLTHALACKHLEGLRWLTGAVLFAKEHEQQIAEELFILPRLHLYRGESFFPEARLLSVMMRLAQFKVAIRLDPNDPAVEFIVDRLAEECRMVPRPFGNLLRYFLLSTVLAEYSVPIKPCQWLPLLRELLTVLDFAEVSERVGESLAGNGLGGRTIAQFRFFMRAKASSNVEMLSDLFAEMDALDPELRQNLLASLREPDDGAVLVVGAAWLPDMRTGAINEARGRHVATEFLRLSLVAERWVATDLATELVCAQVVMLDEYAFDSVSAINAIRAGEERFPNDPRLARRREMIHYRKGDYVAALNSVGDLEQHVSGMGDIEAAFFLRRVGVSFAETEKYEEASRAFELARLQARSATTDSMAAMSIGLQADRARVEYARGEVSLALKLLFHSLVEAESLPPECSSSERWLWISLAETIKWFWCQEEGPDWRIAPVVITYGLCSDVGRSDECEKWKLTSPLICWYALATAEQALELGSAGLNVLRERTALGFLPGRELVLQTQVVKTAIRRFDWERFRDVFPTYLDLLARWSGCLDLRQNATSQTEWPHETFNSLTPLQSAFDDGALEMCSAFVGSAIANGSLLEAKRTVQKMSELPRLPDKVRQCMEQFLEPAALARDRNQYLFRWLGKLSDADLLGPRYLYLASVLVWQWLPTNPFRSAFEYALANFLCDRWVQVADKQSFALKRLGVVCPAILRAASDSRHGVALLALVLVAAENGVDCPEVPLELRELIRGSLDRMQ